MRAICLIMLFSLFKLYRLKSQDIVQSLHGGNDSSRKLMEMFEHVRSEGFVPRGSYISFVDQIIKVDSNYYEAFVWKYNLEASSRNYDTALMAAKRLIELEPDIPENYVNVGVLYTIKGHKTLSKTYFKRAEKIYNNTLDTFPEKWYRDWFMFKKGLNLIYLGKYKIGNAIFKQISPPRLGVEKRLDSYINKSKRQAMQITIKHYYEWH